MVRGLDEKRRVEGGAAGAIEDEALLGFARELPKITHALDGLRRASEDDKGQLRGTYEGIRRSQELGAYLARGWDTLTVDVCATLLGKELFTGLKRACSSARHLLQQRRFPVLITNRLAYGIAALSWGGRDHRELPPCAVSMADFTQARAEDFHEYVAPMGHKLEGRAKHPLAFATWRKQAENGIAVFSFVYGKEHAPECREALRFVLEAHEQDEHAYPGEYVYGLWEEICAAWIEEFTGVQNNIDLRYIGP